MSSLHSEAGSAMNASMESRSSLPMAWVLTILCTFILLSWLGVQVSNISARPSPAALGGFSVENVMASTRRIATEPHPMGSQANAAVRDHLVAELEALGIETQVQQGFSLLTTPNGSVAGFPRNIVARLPGHAPGYTQGKALMLSAHYDSVVNGFGAADDGASVAAILETIRVLKMSAPLRNDLIVLLTDGEEAGLLGAHAFVAEHPWAKEVGLALNFEFRGNDGPIYLFETSPGNGKLISGFATAPRPVGSSLMYEVYRLMPNSTDMSVFKETGIPGMNFAAISGMTSYHTRLDRAERISQATLQHQGETMLTLTRYFGNADLAAIESADAVFFNVPGIGLVSYPASWVLPLSIAVALLFAFAFWRGVHSSVLRIGRTLLALPVFLLIALLLAALCLLLWMGICAIQPGYAALSEVYNYSWYWLAFIALTLGAFALVVSRLRKCITPLELAMGAMLGWLLALFMSVAWAPGINFLLVFSMVPVLTMLLLLVRHGPAANHDRHLILMAIAAAPAIVLFAPVLLGLFQTATTHAAAVVVFVLVLLLGILAPLLVALSRSWLMPGLPLVAGLALVFIGLMTTNFDAASPLPNSLIYLQNGTTGKAFWLSNDTTPDAWTKAALGATPVKRNMTEAYGPQAREYWFAPAPSLGIRSPVIEVLSDTVSGDDRVIDMRVRSARNAPEIRLFPEGAELHGVTVQGRSVGGEGSGRWGLLLYAIPEQGVDISLRIKLKGPNGSNGTSGTFAVRVIDRTYGLPELGLPPRQPAMMVNADGAGDTVQVVTLVSFE